MFSKETIIEGARKGGAIFICSKDGAFMKEEIWGAIGENSELCFRKFRFCLNEITIFTWSRVPIVKDNGFTWWIHACFK